MEPGKNKSLSLTTAYKLTAADVDLWSANTLVDVYKDESNSLKFRFQDIKSNNWVKVEGTDPVSPVREKERAIIWDLCPSFMQWTELSGLKQILRNKKI